MLAPGTPSADQLLVLRAVVEVGSLTGAETIAVVGQRAAARSHLPSAP
jgi:hypothetical protein